MVSRPARLVVTLGVFLAGTFGGLCAQPADEQTVAVRELIEQNRKLQQQVAAQQQEIEKLSAEMAEMRQSNKRHDEELKTLRESTDTATAEQSTPGAGDSVIRLSAEAGLAFFETGTRGQFPKAEFRVDDAKIFLEAKVWDDIYTVTEIDLLTRESSNEDTYLGAMYADVENVGSRWIGEHVANVRVGRFAIPFGEEYQVRGVMDNPLISHSLSDVWGFDEGVELYGSKGKLSYVFAVQNGGYGRLHDYNADKSVTGRLGYDPLGWLHLSASAMRTGALSAKQDTLSEIWFGNGFFRAIGPAATTQTFHAELYEFDGVGRWKTGHVAAAVGLAHFNDDAPAAHDVRNLHYWYVEAEQEILAGLYGVMRYSTIRVPNGYPLIGFGNAGAYFYSPASPLTENLKRLSLGLGYRIAPPVVLKLEYSLERGETVTGIDRDYEDFFSTELGLKF